MFLSINRRNGSRRVRHWIVAWALVLIHLAAQFEAVSLAGIAQKFSMSVSISMLELAGVVLLLSLSQTFANRRANRSLGAIVAIPLIVYVNCVIWDIKAHWIYLLCIAVTTAGSFAFHILFHRKKMASMLFMAVVCIGSMIWLIWNVHIGNAVGGLHYSLTVLLAFSGLLFGQNYMRVSAGVIVSTFGFLAWAAVFPLAIFLSTHYPGIAVHRELWNIPKFFVAVGMLLTLLEEESIKARDAASSYKSLFELNVAAVYRMTLDGQLIDCNPALVKMLGFSSREEALMTGAQDLYAIPEHRQQYIHHICEQGYVSNYEIELRRRDGRCVWISESATLMNAEGRPIILATAVDITPKKEGEAALRRSEERFSTIFRKSPIMCWINRIDDGTFLDVNDTFLDVMRMPKEEVLGKTALYLGFWTNVEQRNEFVRQLRLQKSIQNIHLTFRDGKGRQREGFFSAEAADVSGVECVIGMMADMTDHKALEDQLRQTQKLEAVGGLAGGIAHDFNNILCIIRGFGELMVRHLKQDEKLSRYLRNLLESVDRGTSLTQQLLTFSKTERFQKTRFEVDAAVQKMAKLLVPLLGADIILSVVTQSHQMTEMDPSQFEQIIVNLAVNARDAMPMGGQLDIRTSFERHELKPGCIKLVVSDTGHGMNAAVKGRLFEPFFTTKEVGKGTGLGLATVYGIIKQVGGKITVESEEGSGSTFTLYIPFVTAPQEKQVLEHVTATNAGTINPVTILVVEDEAALRSAMFEYLTEIGYKVREASSGKEALEIAQAFAGEIKLVITDIVMPEMSGWVLVQEMKRKAYDFEYLLVSGYAAERIMQYDGETADLPFLQKPYSFDKLGSMVRELVSSGKPEGAAAKG